MTSTTGRVRPSGPVLHPRICAAVTAVSCLVHLWLATTGHHDAWLGVLMIALAAVCVPCAVHIWRHSRVGALHQVTLSALAMVALHAVLLLGAGGGGHAHGGGPASSVADTSGAAGQLLVIGLEITTALLAATLVARLRCRAQLQASQFRVWDCNPVGRGPSAFSKPFRDPSPGASLFTQSKPRTERNPNYVHEVDDGKS